MGHWVSVGNGVGESGFNLEVQLMCEGRQTWIGVRDTAGSLCKWDKFKEIERCYLGPGGVFCG